MRRMRLNIPRMVAELRSEIELIDVAIRALERFANGLGIEEYSPTPRKRNRSSPKALSRGTPIPRADEVASKMAPDDLMQFGEAGGETIRFLSQ